MGWYSYNNMKCKNCGYEYKQEIGTLNFYDKGHSECPKCKSEVCVDKDKNEREFLKNEDKFKKAFSNRRKRNEN